MLRISSIVLLALALLPTVAPAQQCADYTDPTHWISLGEVDPSRSEGAFGVAVEGDYVFATNHSIYTPVGIAIFDKSDPYHPVMVGSTTASGQKRGIAVANGHAYVTTALGLEVVDAQDPTNPAVVGSVALADYPWYIGVAGDYAYVADRDSGLAVVNVSVDSLPAVAARMVFSEEVTDVAVQGTHVYLVTSSPPTSGLRIVDVSTPQSPQLIATLPFTNGNTQITTGIAQSVSVSGDHAYVGAYAAGSSSDNGLYVVDVSDPMNPSVEGSALGLDVGKTTVDGDRVYACARDLNVFDVSDPTAPVWVSSEPVRCTDVAVAAGYAFVSGYNRPETQLSVIELGTDAEPPRVGRFEPAGAAYTHVVQGNVLYLMVQEDNYHWSLHSVDISVPSAPVQLDSIAIDRALSYPRIDADGNTLAFYGTDSMSVVDVTNPSAMTLESTTAPVLSHSGLRLVGSHVYLARYNGIYIVDVSTPSSPTLVGSLVIPGYTYRLDVQGSFAYMAGDYGVQVVDVSVPSSPTLRGAPVGPRCFDITVRGDYAYASGNINFNVVDVTNPDAIFVVASRSTSWGGPMSEENGVVSMALANGWAQLFDVSSPADPRSIGHTGGNYFVDKSHNVSSENGYIILSQGGGISIYPGECVVSAAGGNGTLPEAVGHLVVWPNPFNPEATIRYDVARRARVSLRIYDVSGRLVRTLVDGRRDAGRYDATWDGTDDRGHRVASGVYFCRLTAGTSAWARKLVMLK